MAVVCVLSCEVPLTMDDDFLVNALKCPIAGIRQLRFNTDQGVQNTGKVFTGALH